MATPEYVKLEVQILNKLRLERLFQALRTHDLRDTLKVMRSHGFDLELYAGYVCDALVAWVVWASDIEGHLDLDLLEEILIELAVGLEMRVEERMIETLVKFNGDIRHHSGGAIEVMAISVISVSSDSSEECVRTSTGRVILFGTIPTTIPDTTPSVIPPATHIDTALIPIISPTIPPSPDYTPASPDYSPASNTEFDPSKDPSSDHIPPLPAISPFISSTDDSSDNDIPDTPPSPTHGTPFTKTTLSTQSTPVASGALRRRVMVLTPGQPIPHGRP
ncbi:hypothetical protein Tco_0161595 [Tanacetum coccineum]